MKKWLIRIEVIFWILVLIVTKVIDDRLASIYFAEFLVFFLLLFIPLVLAIKLLRGKTTTALVYFVLLLVYIPEYGITIVFGNRPGDSKPKQEGRCLSVTTFNVSNFLHAADNWNDYSSRSVMHNSLKLMNWIVEDRSDVICLQEYYTDKGSVLFDTEKLFKEKGRPYSYITDPDTNANRYRRTVAIFSKYPIVNAGEIFVDENKYNRGAYADILKAGDTIKIVNVHLHSNELGLGYGIRSGIKAYHYGNKVRWEQAQSTIAHLQHSNYPTILCGDFNQTIYSPVISLFKGSMSDAYEKAGLGIGGTMNIPFLKLLRLDHQFVNDRLNVVRSEVDRSIKLSEHFPLRCDYELK